MTRALIALLASIALAGALAFAGSGHTSRIDGIPVFALCVFIAFALQWLAFVPAWLFKSEKFYDLAGSATYLFVIAIAWLFAGDQSALQTTIAVCVVVWALRLGSFLFLRIMQDKKDRRFDRIKHNAPRFFLTWTLQGLWVSFTAAAALAAIASNRAAVEFGPLAIFGTLLWLSGFSLEVIADAQKRRFRRQRQAGGERGKAFIDTGLWALSRHPNYFGEIVLWTGVALMALPQLHGWQYLTLVSPLFVYLLLTRISGIPLLERAADERFGSDEDYLKYKAQTPVLWPRFK
ncbi:MAG: DUF1295 domain-containing protein [Pseudomonadales bacterium]